MKIIGQEKIKSQIKINLLATKVYPHTLFVGGYGMGKTTLALDIIRQTSKQLIPCLGSALGSAEDMISMLTRVNENSILFIDEIQSINPKAEEVLYIAIENYHYYSDSIQIELPKFTLLAATTQEEKLSKPLKSRFQSILKLDEYQPFEIGQIIREEINIQQDALRLLIRASRLNPRQAINLARTAKNYSIALRRKIDFFLVQRVLNEMSIDKKGLNENDHSYLSALKTFKKPIGLTTLSAYTQLNQKTIREDIEPNLVRKGVIALTGRGRTLIKNNFKNNLWS